MTNQFGTYINPFDVENDMKAHLKTWMPTFLGQIERDADPIIAPGSLKVANWTTKTRFDSFPEDQIPMIIIVSPGTFGDPYKHGPVWCAKWILRVTAVCSAPDEDMTRKLAHSYITAVRLAVMQYKEINKNPNVSGVDWKGDNYNLIAASETRTLAASQAVFHVEYNNVLDETEGPAMIAPEPEAPTDPGPWPTVKPSGAGITIVKEPLNGSV